MELELKLMKEREKERDALTGLELNDGQPLNEHMIQMKAKYQDMQTGKERQVEDLKNKCLELEKNNVQIQKKFDDIKAERDTLMNK